MSGDALAYKAGYPPLKEAKRCKAPTRAKLTCDGCNHRHVPKGMRVPACGLRDDLLLAEENKICEEYDPKFIEPTHRASDVTQEQRETALNWMAQKMEEAKQKKFSKVRTMKDALAERPPLPTLVKTLIPLGYVGEFHGESNIGKSIITAQLMMCVASGRPAFPGEENRGYETTQSPVMLVELDEGERLVDDQFRMLGLGMGLSKEELEALPLYYHVLAAEEFSAINKLDMEALEAEVTKYGIKLLVMDTLVDISGGIDESSSDMAMVMRKLRQFAEKNGCTIVVNHHDRKNNGVGPVSPGSRSRGSTSIMGKMDFAYNVTSTPDGSKLTITASKYRFGPKFKFHVRLNFITDANGETSAAWVSGISDEEAGDDTTKASIMLSITNMVKRENPQTKGRLVELVVSDITARGGQTGRDEVTAVLNQMQSDGLVSWDKGPRKSKIIKLGAKPVEQEQKTFAETMKEAQPHE